MPHSQFVYVTYIKSTADKLWSALTDAEFIKQYWFGIHAESDWKQGSPWSLKFPDGRVADTGEILEADPPKRLVLRWRNEFQPELKEEGDAQCVFEIEPTDGVVKLTVTHSISVDNSQFIAAVSNGWPSILSNLKSLLETGEIIMPAKY